MWDEEKAYQHWLDYFDNSELISGDIIRGIADEYPDKRSVIIDFNDLFMNDPDLADRLITDPEMVIRTGEAAFNSCLEPDQRVGLNLRVRNLYSSHHYRIRDIRSEKLNHLISISGVVTKTTVVEPKILVGMFVCSSCGFRQEIDQDLFHLSEPLECKKDEGGCGKRKGSTNFRLDMKDSLTIDYQKVELQETHYGLDTGEQPQKLTIYLEDDITGKIKPGQNIQMIGILKAKIDKDRTTLSKYIHGIYFELNDEVKEIEITDEDKEYFKNVMKSSPLDKLVQSFAPHIIGVDHVKTAMILMFAGGVPLNKKTGAYSRGDIHMLLIGDPGTAKSALASSAHNLLPRAQYVEGGTSEAGLLGAVIKDEFGEGNFTLEAGAMAKADGSICVIDEAHTLDTKLIDALRGPMERQRTPIHKANIHTELWTRTSCILLCNPKGGRFQIADYNKPLVESIDEKKIKEPILDRMDFVFGMQDIANEEKDKTLVKHILKGFRDEIKTLLTQDQLRKYLWWVRNEYNPIIPEDFDEKIQNLYWDNRRVKDWDFVSDPKQLYIRHIYTIIRVAQASAKIRMSNEVNDEDIDLAFNLLMESLKKLTSDDGSINLKALQTYEGKSTESKHKAIMDLIQHMTEEEKSNMVMQPEVIERAEEMKIDDSERLIDRLLNSGELYQPRIGYLGISRQ